MSTHKKKRNRYSTTSAKSMESTSGAVTFDKSTPNKHFAIKTSEVMGRYMVATKNFKPGELIIKEDPLIVGPCTTTNVQCLGCYKILETDRYFKCKGCVWPVCSPDCNGIGKRFGHTKEECQILNKSKSSRLLDYNDFSDLSLHLHAIAPLRCLLLKDTNPESYKALMNMESHNAIRKKNPDIWEGNKTYVVDRIRKDWGLDSYSDDEIHTICGILEVNAFELGTRGAAVRGIYPTAFLMSHDCVPNTNHIDDDEFKLTVRSSTEILVDQRITLTYSYTLENTLMRRKHILQNKFFECKCKRCSDPTELGTFMSSLKCPACKNGWILQKDPLDTESEWICSNQSEDPKVKCPGYKVTTKAMKALTERINDEIESLDCNDIHGMETLLEKYRNVLHPTHYLSIKLKLSLSQLYGKIDDYIITELPDEYLERKTDICKELLKIFDIIEPGFTRLRGVTLYELHAPLMILATRRFEEESISKPELCKELKEISGYLEEAGQVLENEPKTSSEYMIALAAKEALERIKGWKNIIGKF